MPRIAPQGKAQFGGDERIKRGALVKRSPSGARDPRRAGPQAATARAAKGSARGRSECDVDRCA